MTQPSIVSEKAHMLFYRVNTDNVVVNGILLQKAIWNLTVKNKALVKKHPSGGIAFYIKIHKKYKSLVCWDPYVDHIKL